MEHSVTVKVDLPQAEINPNIYGHFAEHLGGCIYEGIWVGEDSSIENVNGIRQDVVRALREIRPSVLRWPGGCFADDYHWRDGIGPRERRPRRVNVHWGEVIETNEFGTHEFMELCKQLGAKPYLCGNVGSGTVREMREWVEYLNFPGDSELAMLRARNGQAEPFGVEYFGVGNENWGCGGCMTPEYYAHQFRRYSAFLFGGDEFKRIACGPAGDNEAWTRGFFETMAGGDQSFSRMNLVEGFAMHYYCGTAGTATEYTEDQWYELLWRALQIESMVLGQRAIMDGFDPHRRIGLIVDEWGTWHPTMEGTNPRFLRQQNTIRDAMVAALTLDVFNRHSDIVVMSNIAQMVNVLQCMVLTDGPEMLRTPTYHVYEMYAGHQGAASLPLTAATDRISFGDGSRSVPRLTGSCSRRGDDLTMTLVNVHIDEPCEVDVRLRGADRPRLVSWRVLKGSNIHDHNTFADPERVRPESIAPSPGSITLPPTSISVLGYSM